MSEIGSMVKSFKQTVLQKLIWRKEHKLLYIAFQEMKKSYGRSLMMEGVDFLERMHEWDSIKLAIENLRVGRAKDCSPMRETTVSNIFRPSEIDQSEVIPLISESPITWREESQEVSAIKPQVEEVKIETKGTHQRGLSRHLAEIQLWRRGSLSMNEQKHNPVTKEPTEGFV